MSPSPQKSQPQTTRDAKDSGGSQVQLPEIRYELRPRTTIIPDKVVHVFAENGTDLMQHLKHVLGEEVVTEDLNITQESVDQKVADWTQKLTPEANSVLDFFKEHKIEIFPVNVKNFESKQKVMEYIGDKIDFNMASPLLEDTDNIQDSMVVESAKDQTYLNQDMLRDSTRKDM